MQFINASSQASISLQTINQSELYDKNMMENYGEIMSIYCKNQILALVQIGAQQSMPRLYYFQMEKTESIKLLRDFLIYQHDCVVYVQNTDLKKLIEGLNLKNIIDVKNFEEPWNEQIIENNIANISINDRMQFKSLVDKLCRQSVKFNNGIRALLLLANEQIIRELEQILNCSITISESYFNVKLGETTLVDLDIIQMNDKHISLQQLFMSYFTQTKTKHKFLQALQNPQWNIKQLQLNFQEIQHIAQIIPQDTLQQIRKLLKQVKSFQSSQFILNNYILQYLLHKQHYKLVIKSIKQFTTNTEQWKKFLNSLQNSKKIIQIIKQLNHSDNQPEYFIHLINIDEGLIEKISTLILRTLNLESSDSIKVYDDVHRDLKKLKQINTNLEVLFFQFQTNHIQNNICFIYIKTYINIIKKEILSNELNNYTNHLLQQIQIFQDLQFSIVNVQSLGYLLKICINEDTPQDIFSRVQYQIPDWQQCYQESSNFYFKNTFTSQLYDSYGDIDNEIQLLESKIIIQIIKQIISKKNIKYNVQLQDYEEELIEIDEYLSQLDYNTTMCILMDQFKLCIPNIQLEGQFSIIQSRHLLSEQIPPSQQNNNNNDNQSKNNKSNFVPNDFRSSSPITILMGPNYSGKSIYIKQIALIVYMAHVGLPVPAKQANITLVDSIFTLFCGDSHKLTHKNYIDQDLIYLQQIIQLSTKRSFIIIDELGKRSSLFSSTIQYFHTYLKHSVIEQFYQIQTEHDGPYLMLATHYHTTIKNDFQLQDWLQILEMQIKFDKQLYFTFVVGKYQSIYDSSMALQVARNILNDDNFIKRGEIILDQIVKRNFLL